MPDDSIWFIYALLDPETKEIRYVGKTMHLVPRLKNHIKSSKSSKDKTHKENWILKVLSSGGIPILEILEK